MSLPEVIEISPLPHVAPAEIVVPGSKSVTNRALILAALADGETVLRGALWSEDTQVMVNSLRELGFMVTVAQERGEFSNRSVTVYGREGTVPPGGTREQPLELFVGNAGTAARFLSALVCLGQGYYRLSGVRRMHERPQRALLEALRQLGYEIETPNDRLPALIHGMGVRPGRCQVSLEESSQFASALLLCAGRGGWEIEVTGENAEESSYVTMTRALIGEFVRAKGEFRIEADASSGSYFWAVGWVCGGSTRAIDSPVKVARWPQSGWQIDAEFPRFWPLPERISRARDLGDSILTAMVLAPLGTHPVEFTDLGRLRVQECERVTAMRTELIRCGARVEEEGDCLRIFPSTLHGAEVETYQDHRLAMAFSILGLKIAGLKIKNPACVKKTFPNFFQKWAAQPPGGLGATIRDGRGRVLEWAELLAE